MSSTTSTMAMAGASNIDMSTGGSSRPMDSCPSTTPMDVDPSTTPMATPNLNWMMIEPFVFREGDFDSLTSYALGLTSWGESFFLGFSIRQPPEISRLYLHWPDSADPKKGSCDLVAAHGNLLLLRLTSSPFWPLKKDESPVYPQEHFIFRASSSSSIELERIPAPLVLIPGSFPLHTIGILSRGEDYVIAQLRLNRRSPEVADLCVFRSGESKWKLEQRCPIKFKGINEYFDLKYWRTDKVLAFKTSIFWVDYCMGGMLSSEVFQVRPTIRYIRLPIANSRNEVRPFQDMRRSLCVTKDDQDQLMFIDVVSEHRIHFGPKCLGTGFSVTCYALNITDDDDDDDDDDSAAGLDWLKVFCVRSDELGPLLKPLTYPLVSMHQANIVYFLMSDKVLDGIDKVSMVTVDMSAKKIIAMSPYVNGVEDLKGKDSEMVKQKSRILQPFIPLELPKLLYPDSLSKRVKKTTETESGNQASASKRVKKTTKTESGSQISAIPL